jgi:hypothetical protein
MDQRWCYDYPTKSPSLSSAVIEGELYSATQIYDLLDDHHNFMKAELIEISVNNTDNHPFGQVGSAMLRLVVFVRF